MRAIFMELNAKIPHFESIPVKELTFEELEEMRNLVNACLEIKRESANDEEWWTIKLGRRILFKRFDEWRKSMSSKELADKITDYYLSRRRRITRQLANIASDRNKVTERDKQWLKRLFGISWNDPETP